MTGLEKILRNACKVALNELLMAQENVSNLTGRNSEESKAFDYAIKTVREALNKVNGETMSRFILKNKSFYRGKLSKVLISMNGEECKVWGDVTTPGIHAKDGKDFTQTVISFPTSINPNLKFHVRLCDVQ